MMLCPSCKTNLTMSERQGIEIDYCPSCRGVWLDRGELDKIIERSAVASPQAGPAPGPYEHDRHWGEDHLMAAGTASGGKASSRSCSTDRWRRCSAAALPLIPSGPLWRTIQSAMSDGNAPLEER